MEIDPAQRKVRLSVRELAAFRSAPAQRREGDGSWRAAVGREWHEFARERAAIQHPEARFEQAIEVVWHWRDWDFHVRGRIDQILPDPARGSVVLREVKTVRCTLPAPTATLEEHFPEAFAQAAIYARLASALPEYAGVMPRSELLFIEIDSGMLQVVPLTESDAARFETRLDCMVRFLEERRNSRLRLRGAPLQPAFETLRDGQATLLASLEANAIESGRILLEAPTGFGKTGIVLEHALRQMRDGLYERCLYLTSKSTGQLETVSQLRRMIGSEARFIQMRNRSEHRIQTAAHTCTGDSDCDREVTERWEAAALEAPALFENGTLDLERAKRIGGATGVCPYALTRACLPYADIWIGDSNYVFAPQSRSVFFENFGFSPERTLLVVDEAHNLPERAAEALSPTVEAGALEFALEEIRAHGAPRKLLNTGRELIGAITALPAGRAAPESTAYLLLDLCETFADALAEARFDTASTPLHALEQVWTIPELARSLAEAPEHTLLWSPQAGVLRATCLDASGWIAGNLNRFGSAILMSATLAPLGDFRSRCGLAAQDCTFTVGHAPWREGAYHTAIDCRIDTSFKHRAAYYETTAATILDAAASSPEQPIAVFFSSFQYAENVRQYCQALNGSTRIVAQPRGADLQAQDAFIDEALLLADAIFLVLGSGYAEGIDKLGGQVRTVVVVGPALPEVNAVQEARMERSGAATREEAFRRTYILPAMRRIHQALGRFVRAPGQRARVLLHCRRFAQERFLQALSPEYANAPALRHREAVRDWLLQD